MLSKIISFLFMYFYYNIFQLKRFHTKKTTKPPKPSKKQPGNPVPRPEEAEGPENEALEAEIRGLSSLSPDEFNKKFEKMLVRKFTFYNFW